MKKVRNSLLAKYLLIIGLALILLPFTFPVVAVLFYTIPSYITGEENPGVYPPRGDSMETIWHAEARSLDGTMEEQIDERLIQLQETYPDASMYWVDNSGRTRLMLNVQEPPPEVWTPSGTIRFMKDNYNADPFTVVAFIGEEEDQGFMVFQLPREAMVDPNQQLWEQYNYVIILGTFVILGLFLFISWIFFYRIRKRLLSLQSAMTSPEHNGIPAPVPVHNQDEIGRLEQAFNEMIHQLEESRRREQNEELLRRQLIANLSHDLRTPLTTIRGHAYRLRHEKLSDTGQASIELIDRKIGYLGELIENLFSYTLLSSGKYPYHPQQTDVARLVRTVIANWYPVFEKEQFVIELELPDQSVLWRVDPQWFERILDNFLQNIYRHARSGRYVAVRMEEEEEGKFLVIEDRGGGMDGESEGKGAGIGLSIVQLMMKEMNLQWDIHTSGGGTEIRIKPKLI